MSITPNAARGALVRIVAVLAASTVAVLSAPLASEPPVRARSAQRPAPSPIRLPEEAAGIDGIAAALLSVYDQFDVLALGEMHDRRPDSDLRIALVRHPDFARKVQTIVVEWASTKAQATLDRYIRGATVSPAEFEQVWKTTSRGNIGDLVSPHSIYTDFFAAVRDVNSRLPESERIRVFGGDAGPRDRDTGAVAVLNEQVLRKHGKALVVYGYMHVLRNGGIVQMLNSSHPGRTFAVIPVGGRRELTSSPVRAYEQFDRALKTQVRPVMVSLRRLPFRDFTAEDFLNGDVMILRGGRFVGLYSGSGLTLGQMADACVYFGRS